MSQKNKKFTTSPGIFLHPTYNKQIAVNLSDPTRYSIISPKSLELLSQLLKPMTYAQIIKLGYEQELVKDLIEEHLIVDTQSEEYKGLFLWEYYNWQRAAFLQFSQTNLAYADEVLGEDVSQWLSSRRSLINSYTADESYPLRYRFPHTSNDQILKSRNNQIDFNAIRDRRSCRSFSQKKVAFKEFETILTNSTQSVRIAEQSQTSGDPLYKFNSFYSWLSVFVYVQNVENLKQGLYFYDVESSKLSFIDDSLNDLLISKLVQGQEWIKGGGFCIFITVDWKRYMWTYRHARAYINLLIQIGELAEEFLIYAYSNNLAGWLTPAVSETMASKLFNIQDQDVDVMTFMKFGYEKKH